MGIKGYKVFNPDWTCRGFQYEVGKTFKHEGNIEMCGAGFHFCRKLAECFNYYEFNSNNKVAEVEAIGNVETRDDKSVTDEIVICKELSWYEVLDLCNTGNWNTGNWNTGEWNTGDCNTGNRNTGNCNTGDCNTGNWNTGNCNTGNWNTGDWNTTNFSTGFFNSIEQPLYIFNNPTDMSRDDFNNLLAVRAMRWKYENNWWIYSENMTDEEKANHPEHETTGGYLKTVDFKTACGLMWGDMTDEEKAAVKDIPNFDAEVFKEITGIVFDKWMGISVGDIGTCISDVDTNDDTVMDYL